MNNNEESKIKSDDVLVKEEQVMKEAETYCKIAKEIRENRWKMGEQDVYIMDRKWLKKWKEYVDYPFIKRKVLYNYDQSFSMNKIKKYEVNPALHPGQIDNSRILVPLAEFLNNGNAHDQTNMIVRKDLNQREDVKYVFKKAWDFFLSRYGGGPEIIKKQIPEESRFSSRKIVEVYTRCISVIMLSKRSMLTEEEINQMSPKQFYISRNHNLATLKQRFIEIMLSPNNKSLSTLFQTESEIDSKNLRLWKINSNSSLEELKKYLHEHLTDITSTNSLLNVENLLEYLEYVPNIPLKDIEYADSDVCVVEYIDDVKSPPMFEIKKVEIKEGMCDWCRERKFLKLFCGCKEAAYCSQLCKDRDNYYHSSRCKSRFEQDATLTLNSNSRKGLVGLQNLGNTCFMNTSLQCMSNCKELTEYFLKDYFKDHFNLDNPIGTQGLLARSYSNLLKNLWYGKENVFSPWNFKNVLGGFQSMFSGYQQQDTQEFLNYLLDGLHEDLNKVKKKPFVQKEDNEKEDSIKSVEEWKQFLRRNQSFLVDLLFGQYKSTLYCCDQNCGNVSTTFDPFMMVSLPLTKGGLDKFEITCYFIFYDTSISPIQLILPFTADVPTISLRIKMAKIFNIHPLSFIITRMMETGELDYFVHSALNVKSTQTPMGKIVFFCFQINPEIFDIPENQKIPDIQQTITVRDYSQTLEYMNKNREEIKTYYSEDFQESEIGVTKESQIYYSKYAVRTDGTKYKTPLMINVDENNGLKDNFIKVVLHLRKYEETYTAIRKRFIFPRVIYINKTWSTKRLHQIILSYFSEKFRPFQNLDESTNLWEKYFSDYEVFCTNSNQMTYEQHRAKGYPYILRLEDIISEETNACVYCGDKKCQKCLVPCSESITVQEMLDKIPKNDGQEIDNTYYYISNNEKRTHGIRNKDFAIEVTWLQEYIPHLRKLNDKTDFTISTNRNMRDDVMHITNCFKNFVSPERLAAGNEWYCPKCKTHQLALKKMEIYNAPYILIIHLKRFRNHCKIDNLVDFPITALDISNYVINKLEGQKLLYDLFAIANHSGGLGGGHYYAYAQNHLDGQWYTFNDSGVSKMDERSLLTSGAYVLFYRRRNLNELVNFEELFKKPFVDYENEMIVDQEIPITSNTTSHAMNPK